MPKGILGRKLGMTQIFYEDGRMAPVTVIEAGPCRVVQRKTVERDGYEAVQLGFGAIKEKRLTRAQRGHLQRAGAPPLRILREIRLSEGDPFAELEEGQEVKADIFEADELVDVTGVTKGKGFAGAIKRHNFRRGPSSHGSKYHRRVGSLGATGVSRVFKGRKLPGRMGGVRRTVQGLRVVKVDAEKNLLLIEGSVPGPKGSWLMIRQAVKGRR